MFEAFGPVVRIDHPSDARAAWTHGLPVIDTGADPGPVQVGVPSPAAAPAITGSIKAAVSATLAGETAAIVTNPISKAVLYEAGFGHPGHTEYLAALTAGDGPAPRPVMMLVGGGLRVALATIHLPLRQAVDAITTDSLVDIGRIVARDLRARFGLPAPRLAFTGLNPHAGEGGALGHEERDIIAPAAAALRALGLDMADPRPADTVFAEALAGRFDAVIAMTHDQGLIPVKTLDFWGGVNTTLGLPVIRTSPDHGTAYDAAAAGTARADSLIAAIRLARALADHEAAADG